MPYLALFVFDSIMGYVADHILLQRLGLRLRYVRKICTFVGLGGAGLFFMLLRSIPVCGAASACPTRPYAVVCVIGAVSIGGASFSGFQVNFLDISPRYPSQLMGISNTLAALPGIFGVMSLAWFHGSFKNTFAFAACMEMFGAIWYVLLGRAEAQQYGPSARSARL